VVHYALSTLAARAAQAADLDPDQISFIHVLRIARRTATATATADFPPSRTGNDTPCPRSSPRSPRRSSRHGGGRTCSRLVKRARHNNYPPRNQATRAPATHTRRPSPSTASHPEQLDQLRLRGIGPSPPALISSSVPRPSALMPALVFPFSQYPTPAKTAGHQRTPSQMASGNSYLHDTPR